MTSPELWQILRNLGACQPARDYVMYSKKGPQWLWEHARYDWQIWLRDHVHNYGYADDKFDRACSSHGRAHVVLLDKFYKETAKPKYSYHNDVGGLKYTKQAKKLRLEEQKLFLQFFTWKLMEEALWKTQE